MEILVLSLDNRSPDLSDLYLAIAITHADPSAGTGKTQPSALDFRAKPDSASRPRHSVEDAINLAFRNESVYCLHRGH